MWNFRTYFSGHSWQAFQEKFIVFLGGAKTFYVHSNLITMILDKPHSFPKTECCEKIKMLCEFLLFAKIIKTFYDLHAFSGTEKTVEVNHDSVNNIIDNLTQPRVLWHLASYIWIDYISIEDSVIFDLDALVPRYIDSSAPLSSSKSALNQFKFSQKRKKVLKDDSDGSN